MNRRIVALSVLALVTLGAGASLAADGLRRSTDGRRSTLRPLIGSIHLSSSGTALCAGSGGSLSDPGGGNPTIVAVVVDPSERVGIKPQPWAVRLSMHELQLDDQIAVGQKRPSATQPAPASPQLVCPKAP